MRETAESTVDAVSTRKAASRLGRAHRYLPVTHAGDEYSVGPWSANGGQLAIAAPAWHGRSLGLRTRSGALPTTTRRLPRPESGMGSCNRACLQIHRALEQSRTVERRCPSGVRLTTENDHGGPQPTTGEIPCRAWGSRRIARHRWVLDLHSHCRGHWFDPSIAHGCETLAA